MVAALVRRFGDFDVAEEAVQEAILKALETWPRGGIPNRPGAWLMTVATRQGLNRLERQRRYEAKLALTASEPAAEGADDRLRLILTCCHPALSREAQVYPTLRAVGGFTNTEIARAFLLSESTVAQRLVRAKRKIAAAGIPFRIPDEEELGERTAHVLNVLYLIFNEGQLSTRGAVASQRDVAEDAAWLTELLCRLLPGDPEPLGLLALMKLHLARGPARFTEGGRLVLLRNQDRSLWDKGLIAEGVRLIERAAGGGRPGRYQLEAAIAACHAESPTFDETDWAQILVLYDMLLTLAPSPVIRLNRAIALRQVEGPQLALREVESLAGDLDGYHLFHATRGELLSELGREELARAAQVRALELTSNVAERALLQARITPQVIA